tara:strand:- start:235 stop:501 length:267 start_codon:yes stop_codon:yes gene_type:complete
LGFFGLTTNDRENLFTQIHEIVFHGKGGYSWEEVYNMPIWLRKFTFARIKEWYDKEKEANQKASKKIKTASNKPFSITPNYRTKASNK